jgi:hypothetical protein
VDKDKLFDDLTDRKKAGIPFAEATAQQYGSKVQYETLAWNEGPV